MIDHFGWLAGIYDRIIPEPDLRQLERLLALPAGGAVLDAGGGTGRALASLAAPLPLAVVCDISRPMLRRAAQRHLRVVQARNEALPFADGTFARVLVMDALHHFRDQARALQELVRALRPGGRIIIMEPDIRRAPVRLVAALERLAGMGSRFCPPALIARTLHQAGLATRVETGRRYSAWIWGHKPITAASASPFPNTTGA
jgi:demethylmenaquinone methyltransferase/2-methoxy-6-polyprenyl-1,4-benzoquinol methylase